jgi:AraC-like DNA-binding protein
MSVMDLGFSDAGAFSHAFRRWHGCAPRELRELRARCA